MRVDRTLDKIRQAVAKAETEEELVADSLDDVRRLLRALRP